MKRSQILAAAGAAAALILLVLTLRQVSALREKVEDLQYDVLTLEDRLSSQVSGISADIRRELEAEASLFSYAEASLDYRDGALVLTASVLPKEVGADETLTLSAGGASAPMTAGADGVYTAELTLPLAAELTPAVAFTSPAGTRQETLDSLWTGDVLTVDGESTYSIKNGGITTVYVGLSPDPGGPVADRADAASLTLEVVDAPTGIPLGTVDMEPAQSPGQGVSTGSTTQAVNANALWYAADVSEYVQGEDYDLEFRAVLTTAGGLELTDPNPVVTLQQNSGSSGDVDFSPAWEE